MPIPGAICSFQMSGWDSSVVSTSNTSPAAAASPVPDQTDLHDPSGLGQVAPAAVIDGGWVIECADCRKRFRLLHERSLALDDEGKPHIAYGGNYLYYAWHDGSDWHLETVDDSRFPHTHVSLALDGSGYAHISFRDYTHRELKYAFRDASGWHGETVASTTGSDKPPVKFKMSSTNLVVDSFKLSTWPLMAW